MKYQRTYNFHLVIVKSLKINKLSKGHWIEMSVKFMKQNIIINPNKRFFYELQAYFIWGIL